MIDTGITFSWLGAYILAGLLGFLGGKVIDKILAVSLKRSWLGKTLYKKTKIIPEDEEGQFDLTKDISDKNKFKLTNFDLRKDLGSAPFLVDKKS